MVLKRFLSAFKDRTDLYAPSADLNIKGKSRLSSFCGLLLSLSIIIFLIVLFIILLVDMVNHKNPLVFISELPGETKDQDIYILTSNTTFQMGFGLVDILTGNPYIDNGIYTVFALIENFEDGDWHSTPLALEPCTAAHWNNDTTEFYIGLWCLKEQQPIAESLYVRGFGDTMISIVFCKCSFNCSQDLDYRLMSSTWAAYYTGWAVNPQLYINPLTRTWQSMKAGIPQVIQREVIITLNTIEFVSDNGWIFESNEKQSVIALDEVNYDMYGFTNTNCFLTVEIMNSGNMMLYNRHYRKIMDIFAQIQGFAAVLIPIFGLLIIPYASFRMYEHAVNDLYQIRGTRKPRKQKKNKNPSQAVSKNDEEHGLKPACIELHDTRLTQFNSRPSSIESMPEGDQTGQKNLDLHTHPIPEQIKPNTENKQNNPHELSLKGIELNIESHTEQKQSESSKGDLNKVENIEEINLDPVRVTMFQWLKSFVCNEPQVKMMSQASGEIEACMDVVTVIKKFMEIDKLKMCLLTKEQRVLFDNLDKPVLSLENESKDKTQNKGLQGVIWGECYEGEIETLLEVYEGLKEKVDKTELDQRLLLLCEKRVGRIYAERKGIKPHEHS